MIPTGFVHGLGKPRRPCALNPRHHDNQNANRYTDRAEDPQIQDSPTLVGGGGQDRRSDPWYLVLDRIDKDFPRSGLGNDQVHAVPDLSSRSRRAISRNSSAEGSRLSFLSIIALK